MDFSSLKNILDKMAGKYYPGIDVCIHHKQREVFRYQAGYSDMESQTQVNPDALYYLFSCTKPITCTAALQLYEKGLFLLTDPVSEYLPEFKDMYVRQFDVNGNEEIVKAKTDITIKQLFNMTSGIGYKLEAQGIQRIVKDTDGRCPTADIVRAIADEPLEFQPGMMWHYGLNHDIIGRLIEVWSGMPFGQYLKANIFDRLGMDRTCFKPTDAIKAQMPPMYTYDEDTSKFVKRPTLCEYRFGEESDYESGGAGLISCVDDYIKFTDAMCNGGISALTGERILNSKTIDVMRTNTLSAHMIDSFSKSNFGYGYGLGVRTFIDPSKAGMLSNIGEFGWDGAAGSYLIIDPEEELSVFCARYTRHPFNAIVNPRITNAIYSILGK